MYPNTNYYDAAYRQPNKLVSDIEKAINGEYSAVHCYALIARMATDERERKQILEIRQDEIKHLQTFEQMYVRLTGKQPKPKVIEQCPNQYVNGLEFALLDEQKTVDFYLEVSDYATDQHIKEVFRRFAADEQNHAVWFLYFYTKARKS